MVREEKLEVDGDEFSKGYFWVCSDNRLIEDMFWVKRSKQQMTACGNAYQ